MYIKKIKTNIFIPSIRIISIAYFFAIGCQLLFKESNFTVFPLYLLSVFFSLILLESVEYDFRSSLVILIVAANLYFAGRSEFSSDSFGGYYIFAWVCYDLFLAGLSFGTKFLFRKSKYFNTHKIGTSFIKRKNVLIRSSILLFVTYILIFLYIMIKVGARGSYFQLIYSSINTRFLIVHNGLEAIKQFDGFVQILGTASAFIVWKNFGNRLLIFLWIICICATGLLLGDRGAVVFPILEIWLALILISENPGKVFLTGVIPIVFGTVAFSDWYASARVGGFVGDSHYSIFDRFDSYLNWLRAMKSDGIDYNFFESFKNVIFEFFPRRLFPDKPYYFSSEMTKIHFPFAFYNGVDLDFGGISESVYNFGIIGPFIFGIFISFICSILQDLLKSVKSNKSAFDAIIYTQCVQFPAFFFFIDWINSAVTISVIEFIFIFMFIRLFERISKKRVLPSAGGLKSHFSRVQ